MSTNSSGPDTIDFTTKYSGNPLQYRGEYSSWAWAAHLLVGDTGDYAERRAARIVAIAAAGLCFCGIVWYARGVLAPAVSSPTDDLINMPQPRTPLKN